MQRPLLTYPAKPHLSMYICSGVRACKITKSSRMLACFYSRIWKIHVSQRQNPHFWWNRSDFFSLTFEKLSAPRILHCYWIPADKAKILMCQFSNGRGSWKQRYMRNPRFSGFLAKHAALNLTNTTKAELSPIKRPQAHLSITMRTLQRLSKGKSTHFTKKCFKTR